VATTKYDIHRESLSEVFDIPHLTTDAERSRRLSIYQVRPTPAKLVYLTEVRYHTESQINVLLDNTAVTSLQIMARIRVLRS